MAEVLQIDKDKAAEMQAEIVRLTHAATVVETDAPELATKYREQAEKLLVEAMAFIQGLGMSAGKPLVASGQEKVHPILLKRKKQSGGKDLVDACNEANVSLWVFTNSKNCIRVTEITDYRLTGKNTLAVLKTMVRVNPLKTRNTQKPVSAVTPTTVKVSDAPSA